MDNSVFKSLTCGVSFKKRNQKRIPLKTEKLEIRSKFNAEVEETAPPQKRKKLSQEYLRQKNLEEISKIRKNHNINVKGAVEKIKPIESFDELFQRYSLHHQLQENIKNFKYSEPTPVQMQILPLFLEQKALKIVAPTGSGE